MTDDLETKWLDLLASVSPDHAHRMIVSNAMQEARDLGQRMEAGQRRMTEMMAIEAYWMRLMKKAGLEVVRK